MSLHQLSLQFKWVTSGQQCWMPHFTLHSSLRITGWTYDISTQRGRFFISLVSVYFVTKEHVILRNMILSSSYGGKARTMAIIYIVSGASRCLDHSWPKLVKSPHLALVFWDKLYIYIIHINHEHIHDIHVHIHNGW